MRSDSKELRLSEGKGLVVERKILEVVASTGSVGVLQKDLWKLVGIDSRRGVRMVKSLERRGLISREMVVYKGKKIYLVKPTSKLLEVPALPPILEDVPCFYCPHLLECSNLGEKVLNCDKLEGWLARRDEQQD